jgi:hypothetical protein
MKRNEDYHIILNHKGFVDINSSIIINNNNSNSLYNYYNIAMNYNDNNNSSHTSHSSHQSSLPLLLDKDSNNQQQQQFVIQILKLNETLINLRKKILENNNHVNIMPSTLVAITTNKQEGMLIDN